MNNLAAGPALGAPRNGMASGTPGPAHTGLADPSRHLVVDHDLVVLRPRRQAALPEDGRARTFELVDTTTSGTGMRICTYHPLRG